MRAGLLRHLVTIQQLPADPDTNDAGQPVINWTDVATVPASVSPLSGRELFAAQQVNVEATTEIRIRYLEGVDTRMRITFEGLHYNILQILDPDFRHIELRMTCTSGTKDI
jgi:SPP1 family predicted phage head-tail adaptor